MSERYLQRSILAHFTPGWGKQKQNDVEYLGWLNEFKTKAKLTTSCFRHLSMPSPDWAAAHWSVCTVSSCQQRNQLSIARWLLLFLSEFQDYFVRRPSQFPGTCWQPWSCSLARSTNFCAPVIAYSQVRRLIQSLLVFRKRSPVAERQRISFWRIEKSQHCCNWVNARDIAGSVVNWYHKIKALWVLCEERIDRISRWLHLGNSVLYYHWHFFETFCIRVRSRRHAI